MARASSPGGRQGVKLQRPGHRLILASGSASRRALLNAAGLEFEVRTSGVDEAAVKQAAGGDAIDTALRLADLKAQAVATAEPDALVIGADQFWFVKASGMTSLPTWMPLPGSYVPCGAGRTCLPPPSCVTSKEAVSGTIQNCHV